MCFEIQAVLPILEDLRILRLHLKQKSYPIKEST